MAKVYLAFFVLKYHNSVCNLPKISFLVIVEELRFAAAADGGVFQESDHQRDGEGTAGDPDGHLGLVNAQEGQATQVSQRAAGK